MVLVLRRAALFVAIVLAWALLAAAAAQSATRDREIVAFTGFALGTVVVKTGERSLYFVLDEQRALRFPVGVGRSGKTWTGVARIEGKYVRPASIGGFVSYGCIRMYNRDIVELYRLVAVGTPVIVER